MGTTRGDIALAAVRFFSAWRTVCLALFCIASMVQGQEAEHPLISMGTSDPYTPAK
jgi:hypothetical protein